MKQIAALLLSVCLALTLCGCGGSTKEEPCVVRIGVFEPSTGAYAGQGGREILGIQYANAECPSVEINGKTYEVQLVLSDNASSVSEAADAAEYLVDKDVSVVLGSWGSDVSLAGGPTFEAAGIAAIGVTCSDPAVTADNSYYYSIAFPESLYAQGLACFAAETLGAKTAYCLGEFGSEYDRSMISAFSQSFEAAGGKTVTDYFPANCADYTGYLNKATKEECELIFTPTYAVYASQIVTQAAGLELETSVLGTDAMDDTMVLNAAKGSAVKLYLASAYQEGKAESFDAGFGDYVESYGEAVTRSGAGTGIPAATAMGYDAYYLALEAMKTAGSTDKADILAKLPIVTFSGICGDVSFSPDGAALRSSVIIKASDNGEGVWMLEKVQTVS